MSMQFIFGDDWNDLLCSLSGNDVICLEFRLLNVHVIIHANMQTKSIQKQMVEYDWYEK